MIQLLLNLGKINWTLLDMKYVSLYYNLDFLGKLYVNLWNNKLCKLVLCHVFVNCENFYSHKLC